MTFERVRPGVPFVELVQVQDLAFLLRVHREDPEVSQHLLGHVHCAQEPFLLGVAHVDDLRHRVGREGGEGQAEFGVLRMAWAGGLGADEVVEVRVRHSGWAHALGFQRGHHGLVVGRLPDLHVFTLGVEQHDTDPGRLRLGDESADGGGLAAAGGAEDGEMPRQHGLAVGGDPDRDVGVAHQDAETEVAVGVQRGQLFFGAENVDRAVGQRAQSRRDQSAADFLAEELHLDAAVVTGHEDAAPHAGRHDHVGVCAQAVGLRERTRCDDAEVVAPVLGDDLDHRLDRHRLDGVPRQQDGNRSVLRAGHVEHGAADRPAGIFGLLVGRYVGDRLQELTGQAGHVIFVAEEREVWRALGHCNSLLDLAADVRRVRPDAAPAHCALRRRPRSVPGTPPG